MRILEILDEFFGIIPNDKKRRIIIGGVLIFLLSLFYLFLFPKISDFHIFLFLLFLYAYFLAAILYYIILPWRH